jgi:hypothetical protein
MTNEATIERISRLSAATAAFVWFYQGLVPKLLGPHADELAMSAAFGIPAEWQVLVSRTAGVGEIALAVCIVAARRHLWPHVLSALGAAVFLVFAMVFAPRFLGAAFNPVAMNSALFTLSLVTILCVRSR